MNVKDLQQVIETFILLKCKVDRSVYGKKAEALNNEAMLHKIQGFGEEVCDMVACDLRCHDKCMDRYLNQRVPSLKGKVTISKTSYDQAFEKLIAEIDRGLTEENDIYYDTTLRNR